MVIDLHAKKTGQYLQAFRKKSPENCLILKFTKSKASNFAKYRWSETKLNLYPYIMVTDLQSESQVNIFERLEKKVRKLFDFRNLLSPKLVILPKIDGA